MKKIKVLKMALILWIMAPLAYGATLSVSPTSTSKNQDENFTVNVLLDTKGVSINGVDVKYLKFNPSVLQVVDSNSNTAGVQVASGSLMPLTLVNSVNNTTGVISFSQVVMGGQSYTGSGTLFTVTFKGTVSGNSTLNFDFTPGGTTDSNVASNGNDILSSVVNGSYTITTSAPIIDTTPPIISNIQTSNITTDSVTITWTTNENSTSQVEYGTSLSYGNLSTSNSILGTSHSVTISNLLRKTTYQFRVKNFDSSSNSSISTNYSFTTQARMSKPPKVSGTKASIGSVILSWENPKDYEFLDKIVILRNTGNYVNTPNLNFKVGETTGQTWTDNNVIQGTTYYYTIFTVDDLGVYSDPEFVSIYYTKSTSTTGGGGGSSSSSGSSSGSSGGSSGGSSSVTNIVTKPPTTTPLLIQQISKNIALGARGDDVLSLQKFLVAKGYLTSDNATGYFGYATESAVQAFQKESGIASSGGPNTTGYGAVGPVTRVRINALIGQNVTTTSNATISTTGDTQDVEVLKAQLLVLQQLLVQLMTQLQLMLQAR